MLAYPKFHYFFHIIVSSRPLIHLVRSPWVLGGGGSICTQPILFISSLPSAPPTPAAPMSTSLQPNQTGYSCHKTLFHPSLPLVICPLGLECHSLSLPICIPSSRPDSNALAPVYSLRMSEAPPFCCSPPSILRQVMNSSSNRPPLPSYVLFLAL